nr:MAG TPA_asm: replisome organizer [Caudoviricetes sp.]
MGRDKRLFARLDLDYADHPKISRLSDAAFRAHVEMILYARKYKTDGVIPQRFASRVASGALSELLANDETSPSLVDLGNGSFQLHGYADMNETRDEIERRSLANSENGRRGGVAKAQAAKRVAKRTASESLSETGGENVAETETETETDSSSSEIANAIPRPEIISLLDMLDAEIVKNGGKKPRRTQKNIDATRLLLDRDGRSPEQVANAIRWCQADEFWRTNILSMSKLREKYEQLRLAAQRNPAKKAPVRNIPKNDEWMYR